MANRAREMGKEQMGANGGTTKTYLCQLIVAGRAGHREKGLAIVRRSGSVVQIHVSLAQQSLHRIHIVVRTGGDQRSRKTTAKKKENL